MSTLDFDNDGWTDLYVANDSNPSALYRNRHDGTFEDIGVKAGCAYSQDGKPQAGMGVGIGDFDRNGTSDILKTNFAGDTTTLYANTGDGFCEDRTFDSGLGLNTRWLGWGAGFADFDNDGWLDIFLDNGHVYPEVRKLRTEAGYEQRKVVYRNVKGRFEDVTDRLGPPATTPKAGRGAAFGDVDNNGTIDVAINNVHDTPDLFLTKAPPEQRWLLLRLVGTTLESQRHRRARAHRHRRRVPGARGARRRQLPVAERSARARRPRRRGRADRIEVRWPNGLEEALGGRREQSGADARRGPREGWRRDPVMPSSESAALIARLHLSRRSGQRSARRQPRLESSPGPGACADRGGPGGGRDPAVDRPRQERPARAAHARRGVLPPR